MKKLFGIAALGAAAVTLASCGDVYEIALVTDGNIAAVNDKSFMQGAYEGIKNYASDKDQKYKYYAPVVEGNGTVTDASTITAIDLAVKGGAEVIVTPGYTFETAIYTAALKYPDVHFILLDTTPGEITGYYENGWPITESHADLENVASIFYQEDEAGFLAGYAAVESGFKKLGFMGGESSGPVTRFGNGFIAGAQAAATDLNISGVEVKYNYLGGYNADASYTSTAAGWYNHGTEVIFVAAGGAGSSVMAAANNASKYVIGVDVNQREDSESVIYSATKNLSGSVENALEDFYSNNGNTYFGKATTLDISNDGIALEGGWDRVPNSGYTDDKYNAVYEALKAGTHNSFFTDNISTDAYNEQWNYTGGNPITLTIVK